MKKIILISMFLLAILKLSAQSQGIAYQAILIDQNDKEIPGVDVKGNYLPNQPITIRFSILNNNGAIDYQEEHQTSTDKFGMINLMIGWGVVTASSPGVFNEIDWNGSPKDLRVEISLGETAGDFAEFSVEKLIFVPYAFHRNITATDSMIIAGTSHLNGQVTINADVNGTEDQYNSYPLRVQGSNQGIGIMVDGSRNNATNFITFWDADGIQGRVEGQTKSELHNSFGYIWDQTYQALMEVFSAAIIVADLVGLDDADAATVEGVELVASIADWAKRLVEMETNVGIAFESGGADYAEWLKKADFNEKFSFGDIVGVKGGSISKKMKKADHYMVVSRNPIVLGNMPPKGEENMFEKVAFLGQVSVKVRGKVEIGDFIIASDLNDGFGIATKPENISLEQYYKVIGVAWSESANNNFYSMVNVVIGINTNLVTAKLKQQSDELHSLKIQLNQITSYLKSKDPDFNVSLFDIANIKNTKQLEKNDQKTTVSINESVSKILKNKPELLENILSGARKKLDQKGVNYDRFDQTKKLVSDANYFLQLLEEY